MIRSPHRCSRVRPLHARRLTAFVGAAMLLAVSACAAENPDAAGAERKGDGRRDELTVVLEWTPNTNHAGVYLAQAEGWYADAGLDVTIIEPGDSGSLQLLGSGKADVAFTPQEELIPARAEGVPVVALAAVIQHNTSSLLSLADSGVTRPRALEGKTYGGYGGVLEKALIDRMVECDGGDPAEVTQTEVGNADYRVGLDKGRYDTVWIFDAWDGIRLREIDELDTVTIPFRDYERCIPDWYTPMLATTEKAIDGRPEVLRRFMAATARGYRTAMADPQQSADALVEAVPELDRRLVERSAEYLSTRYAEDPGQWGRMDAAVWTRFMGFLDEAGLIEEPIDADEAYTNNFL